MSAQAAPTRSLKMPLAALAALALAIAVTGYFYLQHQLADARRAARQEIMAIADLKVSQITTWLGERRGNAGAIVKNPIMREQVWRFMGGGGQPGLGEELRSWLEGMQLRYGYEQLAFYDASGNPRLGAPWPLPTLDAEGLAQALATPDVTFTDLHQTGPPGDGGLPAARLTLWAPIAGGPGQPALGAMQLLVDPQASLFPMVRAWPTPSPSAEVLLLRREGKEAVVLAETRHHHHAGHSLRQPLEPPGCLPMALAVLGGEMPEEGAPDHRGVPVLAVSRPVPGTPWFLLAKVDLEEVHAGLRRMAWTTGLVMVLLLLAAAAGLGLFWRQRDNQWLRRQLAVDSERRELAQRVIQLNQQANDIVLLLDQDWQILEANQRAVEAYGYSQAELIKMNGRELRAPAAQAAFDRQVAVADLRAGAVYETLHRRKDGGVFPVEVSIRQVELGGEKYRQSFIRDISERKRAEQALARSEAELSAIFHGAPVMMILVDQDRRVVKANRAALEGWGRSEEEALGLRGGELLRCLHMADHPQGCGFGPVCQDCQARNAVLHTLNTGQPIHRQEVRLDLDKGQGPFTAWLLISTSLLQNHTHPLVLVCLEDIGERKRAELALKQSEERFRLLFEEAPLAYQSLDEEGRILEVNQAWLKALGYRREEVIGRWFGSLLPEEFIPHFHKNFPCFKEAGQIQAVEFEMVRADGATMLVSFNGAIGRDAQGNFKQTHCIFLDITEQRRAEEALRESLRQNAFLAQLLENSSQPLAVGYPGGRIGRHNQAFLDLVGYGAEELRGLDWSQDLTPERWRQSEAASLAQLARTGQPVRYEKEYIRKDGSLVPIELLVNVVRDQEGQPEYYYAFVTDISARKQAEEEHRGHIHFLESLAAVDQAIKAETGVEKLLWRVVNTVFDIFGCDRAWLFYPGDPLAATFRVPVEVCRPEYPGAGILDTDLPLPADMAEDLAYILASEEPSVFGPDQPKPVNALTAERFGVRSQMVLPVYPKTGQPWIFGLHQCSHARAWTAEERKLFKEIGRRLADGLSSVLFLRELRQSEERFRATFEQAAVGMAHCDPQGRFLRVNRRFCDFLGYSPEEMLTLSFSDVTHPEDRSQDLAQIARLIAGESEVYSRQKRYLKKDGAVAWARLTVSVVRGAQGQALYNMAVVEDITEQRQLEAQLRQAQKMEAMGTLAGGIAHDFNNILGAVLGYAEMALDDAQAGHLNPQDLEQVIQAALRAKNLVRQILTFSRKSEAELRPLDLNQVVAQARAMLERTLPKMIEIETRLAPDLAPINGDPNQMEQVLLNLATNAQDAMPQGGRLSLETQNITLDRAYSSQHTEVLPGDYVLLMISDSGQGMDTATRDKAFDPFFTTKEVGKGTGLGLSMVYGIVKAHRGHVFCYSEPGLGTTFKIYLPVYSEQAPSEAAPGPALDEEMLQGSETILLVDDEAPLRQVGSRILEGAGYQVRMAASGEEALEVLAGLPQPPGLVVLDLGMPGMGGQKCLERLLALDPGQRVVIASGYAVAGQVRQALETGARGYVSKPFRRLELLSQVRAVLDRD